MLVIALLTARWLVLTKAMGQSVRFLQLLRIRQAGQLISFVTPGPQFGGEPLQIYWLWKKFNLPGHAAFLAVGRDRFFELWINFAILLFAVTVLLVSTSVAFVEWHYVATVLIGLLVIMGMSAWLLVQKPLSILHWIKRATQRWHSHIRLQQLQDHWSQMNDSLQTLISKRRPSLLTALSLSLLGWAGMIAEFWLLLWFVDVPLDLMTFVLLFTLVRLAFLLPLPGGIGSVEAALFWAFQALALPLTTAAGLIALMRLRDVIILLLGAVVLPSLQNSEQVAEST